MKKNELIAYAGSFVSYALERLKHPVQEIILFGSIARGDFTDDSDVDIFFDVGEKNIPVIVGELDLLKKKFYKSKLFEIWKQKGISPEISLKAGVLKEWELARSILSDGIVLYGKFKGQIKGRGFTLISIKPIKNITARNRIIRALCGRNEKKQHKEGIIEKYGGKKLSPTVFLMPLQFSGEIIQFFKKEKADYEIIEIWSDLI